jgi:hypothetical protein
MLLYLDCLALILTSLDSFVNAWFLVPVSASKRDSVSTSLCFIKIRDESEMRDCLKSPS